MSSAKPRRMLARTTLIASAGLLVLVLLFRILAPALVSSSLVRESMETAVEAWLGHEVAIEGSPELTFWPRPLVTLSGITIRDGDGPDAEILGRIGAMSARFSILEALRGKPVFEDFDLVSPDIKVTVDDAGKLNWSSDGLLGRAVAGASAQTTTATTETPDPVIGDVEITGGRLEIADTHGRRLALEDIQGSLSWPRLSSAARLRIRAAVRDQVMDIDLGSPQPLMLLAGRSTEITASLQSALASLSFSGRADLATYAFFSGDLQLSVPRVADVVRWANLPIHTADRLTDLTLSASLITLDRVLRFDRMAIAANGTRGTGVMDLIMATDKLPPRVTGTLAFDRLDLWALVTAISDDRTEAEVLDPAALPPFERQLGFDVRFSANEARLGRLALTNAAVSILSDARRAQVDILDSDLSTGSLTGQLRMDLAPQPVTSLTLLARNVDAESVAQQMSLSGPQIAGPVSLDANLSLSRAVAQARPEDLAGTLHLTGQNGTISGLAMNKIRGLAATSSYFSLNQAGSGNTGFDTLEVLADLSAGSAEIRTAKMVSAEQTLSLAGVIPYLTHSLSLSATLDDTAGGLPPLNLFIGGAWPDPVIWPALPLAPNDPSP
ncbi:AsmA family protein [Rhizobium sp. 0TCS1.26]|uniref:AsmA family protein n=1 Tax=Rhizobium sp. 0TCS1.26 TaxID=3142623 RepID=UPI003D276BCF